MAERKSVNKYYPPDWDPSKGSVNKYVGQHPLRDRAKKLSQGILVIRFEMPYNIWCGGCNSHIGMGVRYNAEKTKTGMYYTTPIYKFRMKCHLCPNYFEIQTDPKNHDYVILEGARRKEQRWDPKENEQIVPEDRATHKKMATDAMFKLEHGSDDVKKGKAIVMTLSSLEGRRDGWKDDYILNKIARQKFRNEKKTLKSVADSDAALLSKSSLEIPLVEEKEQDKKLAHLMKYRTVQSFDEKQAQKRKEIESKPIFQPSKAQKLDSSPTKNKKLVIVKKHFLSIGNKKTCPFNSNRLKNHSKSSLDKVSLGIKRKSSRNDTAKGENVETNTNLREVEANSIVMGMNVTDSVIDDCETESPDDMIDRNVSHSELDIGNDMSNLENNAAHTDEIEINVNGSEKSRASANEDLESDVCHSVVETDVLQKCSNVIKGPVKDEMNSDIKLENIAHQNFQNLKHQIAKEIKAYSGDPTSSYKYNCADISETSMSHSKEKLQLVSIDETLEEKHFKSKYTCDSKDNSSMTESGEAVSDITPRCDLENEIYKAGKEKDTEREIEVNPILETKIDRKSLSLVAIYSDSETDNSDSS